MPSRPIARSCPHADEPWDLPLGLGAIPLELSSDSMARSVDGVSASTARAMDKEVNWGVLCFYAARQEQTIHVELRFRRRPAYEWVRAQPGSNCRRNIAKIDSQSRLAACLA
jgi:hypothetical protein